MIIKEGNKRGFIKHDKKELVILTNLYDTKIVEEIKKDRIIRNDGEIRYLRASGKMIKNLKNEKILLGITSDVTEEIENQKNISEKNIEKENKNRTL